jgi:hypothetical protein
LTLQLQAAWHPAAPAPCSCAACTAAATAAAGCAHPFACATAASVPQPATVATAATACAEASAYICSLRPPPSHTHAPTCSLLMRSLYCMWISEVSMKVCPQQPPSTLLLLDLPPTYAPTTAVTTAAAHAPPYLLPAHAQLVLHVDLPPT